MVYARHLTNERNCAIRTLDFRHSDDDRRFPAGHNAPSSAVLAFRIVSREAACYQALELRDPAAGSCLLEART